jgi:hypothetical protein
MVKAWISKPTNIIKAAVDDLYGNTGGTLMFELVDQIKPRILSAQTDRGAINGEGCGDANDGIWCVGDQSGPENYSIAITMSEPVVWDVNGDSSLDEEDADLLHISARATPTTTYSTFVNNLEPTCPKIPRFEFQLRADKTVAKGDTFKVLVANDTSGNAINPSYDEIVLNAAGSGYDIK